MEPSQDPNVTDPAMPSEPTSMPPVSPEQNISEIVPAEPTSMPPETAMPTTQEAMPSVAESMPSSPVNDQPVAPPNAVPAPPTPKVKTKRHIPMGAIIVGSVLLVFVILLVVLAFHKK